MPLRDHFRPPLDDLTSWQGLHAQSPAMIVLDLNRRLPRPYSAEPRVHFGSSIEMDAGAFHADERDGPSPNTSNDGGAPTAVWAPPHPTLTVAADLPALDEFAVRVFHRRRARRLVAAVEIVSPSSKDRPEHRQ